MSEPTSSIAGGPGTGARIEPTRATRITRQAVDQMPMPLAMTWNEVVSYVHSLARPYHGVTRVSSQASPRASAQSTSPSASGLATPALQPSTPPNSPSSSSGSPTYSSPTTVRGHYGSLATRPTPYGHRGWGFVPAPAFPEGALSRHLLPLASAPLHDFSPPRPTPTACNEQHVTLRELASKAICLICRDLLVNDPEAPPGSSDATLGAVKDTWCKHNCGQSFHKSCVDDWLDASAEEQGLLQGFLVYSGVNAVGKANLRSVMMKSYSLYSIRCTGIYLHAGQASWHSTYWELVKRKGAGQDP